MTTPWLGEVAVVTGGAGDIGDAIVQALLDKGVAVAVADLRPRAGSEGSAADLGGRRRFEVVDASRPTEVEVWLDAVVRAWGVPTMGILCTGVSGHSRLVDTTAQEWREVLAAGLDAPFYVASSLIRRMVQSSVRGRIVLVGSWAASAPHPHIGAYSVAKAGLRMLTRTLALDHARDGILVNEVAPGIVDAGLSKALFDQDPELRRRTTEAIPLRRTLQPHDVARDVLHLCSPDNRVTTGTALVSDGGLSLASPMNTGRDDG